MGLSELLQYVPFFGFRRAVRSFSESREKLSAVESGSLEEFGSAVRNYFNFGLICLENLASAYLALKEGAKLIAS